MTDLWSPDIPVDRALVERVLAEQFPQLDRGTLVHAGTGWDHEVWRCDDVVFRFPIQHESARAGRDRADALARLAPRLPVPVPVPLLFGEPTPDYPAHCVGYRYLPGELAARCALTSADRTRAGIRLAELTRAIHAVPLDEARAWGLQIEGERGSMAERVVHGRQRAEQLADTPFAELARQAADAMEPAPPECTPSERRVVHGDLHAGQTLFAHGQLTGVIDWDALNIGDPAFDLLMAHGFVPAASRAAFWARYGETTASARARHLALSYGLALLAQGVAVGDDGVRDEAAWSLANALQGTL